MLNAGDGAAAQIQALQDQTLQPSRVIVLDSESTDGSPASYAKAGCEVHCIPRRRFDHGGTRNVGARLARDAEVIVFLTQDALPAHPEALERIVAPFADPLVGLVCGRQLPRPSAGPIERHARCFNYPQASSRRDMTAAQRMGVKAMMNSNSFAAYRTQALLGADGFPEGIIMGEDQAAAARLLICGWTLGYVADAAVFHSHDYSVWKEFRRYFDVGAFHAQQQHLVARFGDPAGEGLRFIRSEIRFLAAREPERIPEALLRDALKLLAYRLGRHHVALPGRFRTLFAMNRNFFGGSAHAQAEHAP